MDIYNKQKIKRSSKKNSYNDTVYKQIGALCFKFKEKKLLILLIKSRRSKRWVIPKGWKLESMNSRMSVAVEAWEEAGVQGKVSKRPIGFYYYRKARKDEDFFTCEVKVYSLNVAQIKKKFPEMNERQSKWFSSLEASKLVNEPELKRLILKFERIEKESE